MDNHYHLFIQTPDASLVKGRKWFQNTVTRRFIVRHREWGRLFGDRYKAVVVEGESPYYYETLWDYIHLNPGRSGLAEGGAEIADFCGVEFGAYGFKGGAWGQGALPGGQAGCLDVGAINPAYSIGFSSDIIEPAGHFLVSTAPRQTPESPPPPHRTLARQKNGRSAKKMTGRIALRCFCGGAVYLSSQPRSTIFFGPFDCSLGDEFESGRP